MGVVAPGEKEDEERGSNKSYTIPSFFSKDFILSASLPPSDFTRRDFQFFDFLGNHQDSGQKQSAYSGK
nr:hypothetical protein [uncultured Desulfobulbus sp.]